MTEDPDIRFASSLIDYIFRRIAVDYLPLESAWSSSVGERMNPHCPASRRRPARRSPVTTIMASPLGERGQPIARSSPRSPR
jgi:hypothetical protein